MVISTEGDITIGGNSWTTAILDAPNGDITLSGNLEGDREAKFNMEDARN